jgi:hypothetical protein
LTAFKRRTPRELAGRSSTFSRSWPDLVVTRPASVRTSPARFQTRPAMVGDVTGTSPRRGQHWSATRPTVVGDVADGGPQRDVRCSRGAEAVLETRQALLLTRLDAPRDATCRGPDATYGGAGRDVRWGRTRRTVLPTSTHYAADVHAPWCRRHAQWCRRHAQWCRRL